MSEPIKMPPVVQAACDAVVVAILANQSPPDDDLKMLQGWFEVDGWKLIADWPGEILLTNFQYLSFFFGDDWVTSEFLDWVPDEDADVESITDEDRLKWGRYICTAVSEGKLEYKEDLLATAHFVALTSTKGVNAYIACVLLFMGQGGFEVEWHGTWKGRQAFDEYLSTLDKYCLLSETAQLSDERILSMWTYPLRGLKLDPTILATRENGSMASGWEEFLCLTGSDKTFYKLFTGQYEVLGSKDDYYVEKTGDYELPDEIDGKEIVGIEDYYIVGGELRWFDDSQTVGFDDVDDPALAKWLTESGWSEHISVDRIKKFVESVS